MGRKIEKGRSKRAITPHSGRSPFKMVVSLRFLLGAVIGCSLVAFYIGRFSAALLLGKIERPSVESTSALLEEPLYTVKHFDTSCAVVTSYSMVTENEQDDDDEDEGEGSGKEEEEEIPNCHHLMVDIEYVDPLFLSSEDRLTESILKLADNSDLTLFYTTCHERAASGLICLAALEKSRLSLTSWPKRRQIAVDLQVCAEDREWALTLLPGIIEAFGTKDKLSQREPHASWAYKRRGFRDETQQYNPDDVDFESLVGAKFQEKAELASVQSPFQRIDVYEFVHQMHTYGSREHSRNIEGEYGPRNPDGFHRDRIVMLDHVEQSMLYGEAAYHEALVHPVMFSHANPRRVAIIGGGEGATLREVLKHKTVERAVMIEIDEVMVNVSRTYLPEWSDCSNIVGSTSSCFEDPRAEIYFEDAIAWFITRYLDKSDLKEEDCFDIIIMDALDPTSVVVFSDMLYDNEDLATAMSNALGDEGVFVLQVGEGDSTEEPPENYGNEKRLSAFRNYLEENGFLAVTEYDEIHGGFKEPWAYQIAFKSQSSEARFFSNEAEVSLAIRRRALPTVDGENPFRFFDGATMMVYQLINRLVEDTWCLGNNTPCESGGHGLDPESPSLPVSTFELKKRHARDVGVSVYAKADVPAGAYIAPEETVQGIFVPPSTYQLLQNFSKAETFDKSYWDCLLSRYLDRLGWTDDIYGQTAAGTVGGIFAFLNPSLDQSFNVGTPLQTMEKAVDAGEDHKTAFNNTNTIKEPYNPFLMRHHARFETFFKALQDIQAGEEVNGKHLSLGDCKSQLGDKRFEDALSVW